MKKIFIAIFACLLAGFVAQAQVTLSPIGATPIDEITIVVDVTGTPMAGETEAYIWIFSNPDMPANLQGTYPAKDGSTNTAWGNSPDAAKLTKLTGNKWQYKFTPTDLFSQTPAQLKQFGFLLKSKTGSKQTPDYKPFLFEPLIFSPTLFRVFPQRVGVNDVITVNFDQSLATELNDQRMTPKTATVTFYNDATPAVAVGTLPAVAVRMNGNIAMASFFAQQATITLPASTKLRSFKYKINGTVLGVNGQPVTVSTAESEVVFSTLK